MSGSHVPLTRLSYGRVRGLFVDTLISFIVHFHSTWSQHMILKGPFKYGYRAYPRQAMYFTMAEGYVNGILTIMSVSRDKPKESRWAAKSLWCTISLPPISSPHNLTITA